MIDTTFQAIDDATLAASIAEIEKSAAGKRLADIAADKLEWVKPQDHFSLDAFRPHGRAWIAGKPCAIPEAINAMIAGAPGLIAGETNTGKSHLAVAIAVHCTNRRAIRIKDFDLYLAFDLHRFRHTDHYEEMLDRAGRYDILIFDDAGKNACAVEGRSTAYGNLVYSIMDKRAESRKQTIITTRFTNIDKNGPFYSVMGADLVRRMLLVEGDKIKHVSILLEDSK